MDGKTVVITGATSGIGEIAAVSLARMGARIVFVARSEGRGKATLDKLTEAGPGAQHKMILADLSVIAEMKQAAQQISDAAPYLDVLINNAGAMFSTRQESADGLEMSFALNHLSYFVLSVRLMENLRAAGGRIICTASRAHQGQHLDFSDLQGLKHYSGYPAYGRSKLCNVLFTREMAKRIKDSGVIINCFHPGFVATRFADAASGFLGFSFFLAKKIAAVSPEAGARTLVYLASSPQAGEKSGQYFHHCMPEKPSAAAMDLESAAKLWDVSAELSGVDLP